MDYELEHRIRFEYQLEQLSNAFQTRYDEERKYTVEMSVNVADAGNNKTLNFNLNNDITVTGIQFDLYVPINVENITFTTTWRSENFEITNTAINYGMSRVIMTCENLDGIIYTDEEDKSILIVTLIPYENTSITDGTVSIKSINITAAEPNTYNKEDMTIKL